MYHTKRTQIYIVPTEIYFKNRESYFEANLHNLNKQQQHIFSVIKVKSLNIILFSFIRLSRNNDKGQK